MFQESSPGPHHEEFKGREEKEGGLRGWKGERWEGGGREERKEGKERKSEEGGRKDRKEQMKEEFLWSFSEPAGDTLRPPAAINKLLSIHSAATALRSTEAYAS